MQRTLSRIFYLSNNMQMFYQPKKVVTTFFVPWISSKRCWISSTTWGEQSSQHEGANQQPSGLTRCANEGSPKAKNVIIMTILSGFTHEKPSKNGWIYLWKRVNITIHSGNPLVISNRCGKSQFSNGKTHHKWSFSIAILAITRGLNTIKAH